MSVYFPDKKVNLFCILLSQIYRDTYTNYTLGLGDVVLLFLLFLRFVFFLFLTFSLHIPYYAVVFYKINNNCKLVMNFFFSIISFSQIYEKFINVEIESETVCIILESSVSMPLSNQQAFVTTQLLFLVVNISH